MPSAYGSTGFTLNNPGDPANWGAVEKTAFQNVIDTLVAGTCKGTKDTAAGHQHYRMFRPAGDYVALTVDANYDVSLVGALFLADDESIRLGNAVDDEDAKIFWDPDGGRTGSGALIIEANDISRDIYIKTKQSGSVILETGSAGFVAVQVQGAEPGGTLPANSLAFYVSGGKLYAQHRDGGNNWAEAELGTFV